MEKMEKVVREQMLALQIFICKQHFEFEDIKFTRTYD